MTWYGTSVWEPDSALVHAGGECGSPSMKRLSNGKLLVTWVSQGSSVAAKHCAAVGSISAGVFTADAQHVLDDGLSASFNFGNQWGYSDGGEVWSQGFSSDGSGGARMVIARCSLDLSTRVTRVIDIEDTYSNPAYRNGAALVGGEAFRFHLDAADGVTFTVTKLDAALADDTTSTFTLSSAYPPVGGNDIVVSGDYVALPAAYDGQIIAHFDGTDIDDVFVLDGAAGAIVSEYPGSPGEFVYYDGAAGDYQRVGFTGSSIDVVSTIVEHNGGPTRDPRQGASGKIWTFATGSSGD